MNLHAYILKLNDKQKEALMRYSHALSVAAMIAIASVIFTETDASWYAAIKISELSITAVGLFLLGIYFGKDLK